MPINWGLAQQPNALAMMMQGFDEGQKLKREERSRNALGAILGQGNNTPGIGDGIPGNTRAGGSQVPWGDLQGDDLRTAITIRGQQQSQQAAQAKQKQEQLIQMGRLLDNARDETTYQQSLAAAKQIGIDTTRAPANFDPNWVAQQKTVLSAFEKDGGQAISAAGQKAIDLGYERGSPEFVQVVRQLLEAEQSKPYVVGGETRLYKPSLAPQTAPQAAPQQILQNAAQTRTITPEEAATVRSSMNGPNGQAAFDKWMQSEGIAIAKTVNGQTFYQVNGQWYDNPEGR